MANVSKDAAHGDYDQPYYVPEQSKFPILASFGMGLFIFSMGHMLNDLKANESATLWSWMTFAGFAVLAVTLFNWFATQVRENHQGMAGPQLKRSYVLGMYWFIFSEVMFFAAFFGALFYVRMWVVGWLGGEGDRGVSNMLWPNFKASWPLLSNPNPELFEGPESSMAWPGFSSVAHYLPLWNTILLLSSSVTVHIAHTALKNNQRQKLTLWLGLTVLLGLTFLFLQVTEYREAYHELGLTLHSGIYGSTFFLLTGFHGFHVTLGAFMLSVMWFRALKGHFKPEDHFGFEAASWYWHFVDVVWVCLFLFVYIF
ncbi:MAG: cytochrome c oxidase subunit 3 [Pseudomonadales bacterium]|jgi:cytochrome c oxidase subunit 3|nr:cytochrome c oxidase subunit 3 [Pseudomonadales bacterium]